LDSNPSQAIAWKFGLGDSSWGQVDVAASSFIRADSHLDKLQKVAAICPNKTAK